MDPGSDPPADAQPDTGRSSLTAGDLTGELPQVVRDALDRGRPRDLTDHDRETIAALVDLGLDEDHAREAVIERRVPLVLTSQVLGEQAEHTLEEVAAESGVPERVLVEIRTATGLSNADRFTDTDVEWARLLGQLLEILPVETVVRSARARGAALSAIARNDVSVVRDELILPMRQSGADDLTVSVALAEAAKGLDPISRQLLVTSYRLQLQNELNSELSAIAAREEGQELDLAVGFVDVVGYTALSARIDPEGLDQLLDAFQERVIEVVSTATDVAVVKYLGDAVMLVAGDLVALADTMLELTATVEELEEAPLRGGLAAGEVLVREGDFFGPTVNLAARLTDMARAWSLLADEHLVDRLDDRFDVRRILPTRIRGLGLRRPLAVRRRGD